MAAITSYAVFSDSRVDGLCPQCFLPGLKRAILQRLDMDGITPLGDRIFCRDCRAWVTPLRKYENA